MYRNIHWGINMTNLDKLLIIREANKNINFDELYHTIEFAYDELLTELKKNEE